METCVTSEFLAFVSEETGIPCDEATAIDVLGLDSLDFLSLLQSIGEKFKEVPDAKIAGLNTVGDILKAIQ